MQITANCAVLLQIMQCSSELMSTFTPGLHIFGVLSIELIFTQWDMLDIFCSVRQVKVGCQILWSTFTFFHQWTWLSGQNKSVARRQPEHQHLRPCIIWTNFWTLFQMFAFKFDIWCADLCVKYTSTKQVFSSWRTGGQGHHGICCQQ